MRWLLRKFGFRHVDYGYSMGRAFIAIDGVTIVDGQTIDTQIYCDDETVKALITALFRSKKP